MGVDLFDANEQTDMTELILAFRNFANTSKNQYPYCCTVHIVELFN